MCRHFFAILFLNIAFDRIDSTATRCDEPEFFRCDTKCMSSIFLCDGEIDCIDGSDENNCNGIMPVFSAVKCATDEFQCANKSCISIEKFCDSRPDCADGSDEYANCVKEVKCDKFLCNDGHCIRNEWVCDGVPDCPDTSDEHNCESKPVPIDKCTNAFDRYLCENRRCISLNATCNEEDDCGDGSDESVDDCRTADSICNNEVECEHHCRRTPLGAQCSCRPGYKLIDNRTCADVNECETYGICDQLCTNTPGSYLCSCQHNYILGNDNRTCKAEGGEALIVYSVESEIRGLYLDSKVHFLLKENLENAAAVSLDADCIYWSDIKNGKEAIFRSFEGELEPEVVVTFGLNRPEAIAVDWITGNLYFTDSHLMHIGACNNNGTYCTVVIEETSDKPRGLALLPPSGIMYWTEWSVNSRISMASMDGKNNSLLVSENLVCPNSLAIDNVNGRLYWMDGKLKLIESIRLDGSDRRIVLQAVGKTPFSLAVFENKLYWSDRASGTVRSCDKFTGKDWKTVINASSAVYGIDIYHSVLKPNISNPCESNACSELCLLNPEHEYTCACTLDKELDPDQHTCRAVNEQMRLIVAAGDTFLGHRIESLGKPKVTSNVVSKNITLAAYNPLTDGLLVVANDRFTDIFELNTSTGALEAITSIENVALGGMDFDYVGNNIYMSDTSRRMIVIYNLNTNEKTVLFFEEEPHAIALVPEEGIMFVVFRVDGSYRIDLMKIHGIGPRTPIEGAKTRLLGPTVALCYHRGTKRLFWSDQGTGRIGSTTTKGFETRIFRDGLAEPVSLAVVGNYVFWSQYKSAELFWTSMIDTEQHRKSIASHLPKSFERSRLISLAAAHENDHECRRNNGNCSHVCLVSDLRSHICACPPGAMLLEDDRTCAPETSCWPNEMKCRQHDVCIKLHQRCDGVKDCPNGDDESDVCDEFHLSKCVGDGQFRCKSGECISEASRCNSRFECRDMSDEEGCQIKRNDCSKFEATLKKIADLLRTM
ncbi:vitellogenin receptor [Megalopta genalis]|uniref:vitellogenin receptor n=1 Tax=Megalopta genalis TaxID=115081 RepID=UPI003FD500B5